MADTAREAIAQDPELCRLLIERFGSANVGNAATDGEGSSTDGDTSRDGTDGTGEVYAEEKPAEGESERKRARRTINACARKSSE